MLSYSKYHGDQLVWFGYRGIMQSYTFEENEIELKNHGDRLADRDRRGFLQCQASERAGRDRENHGDRLADRDRRGISRLGILNIILNKLSTQLFFVHKGCPVIACMVYYTWCGV